MDDDDPIVSINVTPAAGGGSRGGGVYIAKCAAHSRSPNRALPTSRRRFPCLSSDNVAKLDVHENRLSGGDCSGDTDDSDESGGESEAEDGLAGIVGESGGHPHLRCACFDPDCKIKRHLERRQRRRSRRHRRAAADDGGAAAAGFRNLHPAESASLRRAHDRLLRDAGGVDEVAAVYRNCLELYERNAQVLSDQASEAGDTVLMLLCSRNMGGDEDGGGVSNAAAGRNLLLGQIASFIRLYLEIEPSLLFKRNQQGSNALVLAALSNKSAVSNYLALLYADRDRDANEPDADGHTVLHLMARKGDDCADALEEMLALRDDAGRRLLRLDAINAGGKTPLDVAVACESLYATGRARTVYSRSLQAFHDVIQSEAREMVMNSCDAEDEDDADGDADQVPMTFRNF